MPRTRREIIEWSKSLLTCSRKSRVATGKIARDTIILSLQDEHVGEQSARRIQIAHGRGTDDVINLKYYRFSSDYVTKEQLNERGSLGRHGRNRECRCGIEDTGDIASCHSLDEGECEVLTIPSRGSDPSLPRALCVRNDVSLPHPPIGSRVPM